VGRPAAHGHRDRAAGRAADAGGQLVVYALQQPARRAVQEPRVRVLLVAGPAHIININEYNVDFHFAVRGFPSYSFYITV